MKKLLGILVLGLFVGFNPLVIKYSYAGLLDVFKDPVELCMDRVIAVEGKGSTADAAFLCAGATKGTKKCMDRVIAVEGKGSTADAAKLCTVNK